METRGLGVSPGFHAFAGLKRLQTVNIEPPWGKCNRSLRLDHYPQYTFSGCIIECKLQKAVEKCGCKPLEYPGPYPVCSPREIQECVQEEMRIINQDFSKHCSGCTVPCYSTNYNIQLSYVALRNATMHHKYGQHIIPSGYSGDYVQDNLLALDVYYEELNLESMEQKKAVEESGLLSDIGGQLGLFMGFSALTFIEFFEYIILKFRRLTRRRKLIEPIV
ncbi:acid-sensing ion channel 2-like [Lingula anatina]|uniref:Acid-sensing ion channel 2-like n=1 Tax=Lingula anatina TaxID=7574 RepID=A0A1S3JIJ4_LINAN|nr:acid-sensing ion channel 2-like [Lingula anatina]|eukprot:XP_013410212.1 acid-sensing ion channel 2-like [Lingula anatina]